jgi:hypothetical protein
MAAKNLDFRTSIRFLPGFGSCQRNPRTDFRFMGDIRVISGILDNTAFRPAFLKRTAGMNCNRYSIAGQKPDLHAGRLFPFQNQAQSAFGGRRRRRTGCKP